MDWSQGASTVVIDCWRVRRRGAAQEGSSAATMPLGIQRRHEKSAWVITTPGYRERFDHLTN